MADILGVYPLVLARFSVTPFAKILLTPHSKANSWGMAFDVNVWNHPARETFEGGEYT